MQLLVLTIDDRAYAVPAAPVIEIVRAVAVTPLPGAPPVVAGIIDVRGTIVPVFDMRLRFGGGNQPLDPSEHFVIVDTGARKAALRVDRAEMLRDVPEEEIAAVTSNADHIRGIGRLPDGLVLIHDPATFLSAAESASLDEAIARIEEAPAP